MTNYPIFAAIRFDRLFTIAICGFPRSCSDGEISSFCISEQTAPAAVVEKPRNWPTKIPHSHYYPTWFASVDLPSNKCFEPARYFQTEPDHSTWTMSKSNSPTDRRALLRILTVYTDAICLRDISTIPLAKDARITDNGQLTTLGKGAVWQMDGKLRLPYRRALVDAKTGAACLRATVTNEVASRETPADITCPASGQWLWYVVRLKVVGGLIIE